jgi:hypothetical protein
MPHIPLGGGAALASEGAPADARHWNLLTDLKAEFLPYAA